MKHVLVSPLSWGLGHATRDLPVIRYLLERGHRVTIAAEDRALTLLEREVPECDFERIPDYPPPYSSGKHFVPKFVAMAPAMLWAIEKESIRMRRLFRRRQFDLILSDNRFRVRRRGVPSFVLTHQLRFMTPPGLEPFERLTEFFNYVYLHPFDRIIVPDAADPEENLSGRLSHDLRYLRKSPRVYYAGPLASVRKTDVEQDVDLFISISGPEPPRTQLERTILEKVPEVEGERIVVALGKPEVKTTREIDGRIEVHGFLDRDRQQEMLNRARFVVCRSGYTTVMELAELGRKALFIPTPGQTEQVYLGNYYEERGYFHTVDQYEMDLVRDIEKAKAYTGPPFPTDTRANVERLYQDLFAPVLEG
jgi:UDP:flavonoid glycosyltransferase YjiC (YdhE family)